MAHDALADVAASSNKRGGATKEFRCYDCGNLGHGRGSMLCPMRNSASGGSGSSGATDVANGDRNVRPRMQ